MQFNNFNVSRLHIHNSPNAFNSFGALIEDSHQHGWIYTGVQWNHLLKRRNTKHSQANLYLKAQLGQLRAGATDTLAPSIAIAGDWETRRYFTSYAARYREASNLEQNKFIQHARIGIAPYLAEYGNWHTWLMLHVDHLPDNDNELTVTPMVRLFRGNYLFEFGVSNEKDAMFNWIMRY